MAVTVTVGGAGSDSYATLAEYQTYALEIHNDAFTGHGHDAQHEAELRMAARYLDTFYKWPGSTRYQAQARAWPRLQELVVDGWPVPIDTIPQAIKDAQCEIAYQIHQGATPFATIDTGAAIREKVDVIEVEYAPGTARNRPAFQAADRMVADYTMGKSGLGLVKVLR